MAIASISNVQLTVMQLPEVARQQIPVMQQVALANAQAGAIIARQDQQTAESVPDVTAIVWHGVGDVLSGPPAQSQEAWQQRSPRPQVRRLERLAAVQVGALGSLVDIRI